MPWVLDPYNSTPHWVDEEDNKGTSNEYMNDSKVGQDGSVQPGTGTATPGATTPYSAYSFSTGSYGSDAASFGSDGKSYLDMLKEISDQNNQFNLQQVREVNAFNALEAYKNRQWQTNMSNTAHKREVADLLRAGLNPVLSAGGQGAAVGSSSPASGQKAVADTTYGQGVMQYMTAAMQAASAERVAQINAASRMAAASTSASVQYAYQDIIKQNNTANNLAKYLTTAANIGYNIWRLKSIFGF